MKYLGAWLNTPPSERTSLPRLLTYFIEMHPFGSWRTVIWALDAIKEHDLASSLRDLAETNDGKQCTLCFFLIKQPQTQV